MLKTLINLTMIVQPVYMSYTTCTNEAYTGENLFGNTACSVVLTSIQFKINDSLYLFLSDN